MLDLLLSIPKDVLRSKVISCLDLASLVRLDTAATSHECRQNALDHVLANAEIDEDIAYTEEAIHWLVSRQVHVAGMIFPAFVEDAHLDAASSALIQVDRIYLLRCARLSDKGVQSFLKKCGSLFELTLEGCPWLTDDTLRVVAELHYELQKLTIIDAPCITDEGAADTVYWCPLLQCIQVENCPLLGDNFIRKLGDCQVYYLSIIACPKLSEEAVLDFLAEGGERLRSFIVPDSSCITDRALQALARCCSHLDELDIARCYSIGDIGFIALVTACQQLTFLSADACPLSLAALDILSTSISVHMEILCITDCDDICDRHIEQLTTRAPNIEVLNVSGSDQLTSEALITIRKNLPKLTEFKGSCCSGLGSAGFVALAQGCPNLTVLDVSMSEDFNNACLLEIAVNCPHISGLYMAYIPDVSDIGLGYVAQYCAELKRIDITSTSVTETAVMHLIRSCPKLSYVKWANLPSATDELLELVAQRDIALVINAEGLEEEEEEEEGEAEEGEEEDE